MKVGILGSGNVGRALGAGFASHGHEVQIASRDPSSSKVKAWVAENAPKASAGDYARTAAFGDLAVLATAWSGTENALNLAQPANLEGKVVIDVTNPLAMADGGPSLAIGHTDSGAEHVQRWAPGARVVKAFNIVNFAHMVNPAFRGGPPDMFMCGNDEEAKIEVADIIEAFGWRPIDIGGLEGARLLEPLAMLWITCAMRWESNDHAFKLLRV